MAAEKRKQKRGEVNRRSIIKILLGVWAVGFLGTVAAVAGLHRRAPINQFISDYTVGRPLLSNRLTEMDGDELGAVWSPDGTRITFVGHESGDPEIYTVDVATRDVIRLTDNQQDDYAPSYLDVETLTFLRRDGPYVYVAELDEVGAVTYERTIGDAVRSPDGKMAFYAGWDGEGWVIDVLTGELTRVFAPPSGSDNRGRYGFWRRQWSEDGTRVAFRWAGDNQFYVYDHTTAGEAKPVYLPGNFTDSRLLGVAADGVIIFDGASRVVRAWPGRPPQLLAKTEAAHDMAMISPDERYVVWLAGFSRPDTNERGTIIRVTD
ncbi:MAG: hypothetical protein AAF125_15450, partial [Chloroflexota bacterium]